jgi:hypothetical protein
MSEINDASSLDHDALADGELEAVPGGFCDSQYEPAAVELGDLKVTLSAYYEPRSR